MIVALRKLSCRKESCEDPTEPTNDEDEAEGGGEEGRERRVLLTSRGETYTGNYCATPTLNNGPPYYGNIIQCCLIHHTSPLSSQLSILVMFSIINLL